MRTDCLAHKMRATMGAVLTAAAVIPLGLLLAHPATAEAALSMSVDDLKNILPSVEQRRGCFERVYDGEHLRKHPQQTVTSLLLQFRHEYDNPKRYAEEERVYEWRLYARVKGRKGRLYASGVCRPYAGLPRCGVECDGGSFHAKRDADNRHLLISIDDRLRMETHCDGGHLIELKPGTDDKLFRLQEVRASTCASLEAKPY